MARWSVIGQSVLGAAHRRTGMPNQDALGWLPENSTGSRLVLAVADGHGSGKHFRSQEGSRLAVEVVKGAAQKLFTGSFPRAELPRIKEVMERQLPQEIGRNWVSSVRAHLELEPFTAKELATLEQKDGAAARRNVEASPLMAYGSTILAVLVTESFISYLQLGDGDILVVSDKGVIGRPLPSDSRLLGIETTSLASEKDRAEMPVYFQTVAEPPPALIVACTDGYANSYPAVDEPLAEFARGLWKLIGSHGLEKVRENLERWLTDTTAKGSGDDITLGILCRLDAFANPPA